MRSGCPRACGQRGGSDELVCGAGGVVVVADAAGIVTIAEDLCQMLNSLVETLWATEIVN